jgi:ribose transport system substrate-binding protein
MMRTLRASAFSLMIVVAIAACGGGSSSSQGGAKQVRVAAILGDQTNPAIRDMGNAIKAEAAKYPQISLNLQFTTTSEDQVSKAQTMIAQHVDVLGLHPHDAAAITPVIQQAHNAGIKVIILIDDVPGAVDKGIADEFISGDELKGGADLGTWLIAAHPDGGEYAIITGEPGNLSAIYRSGGFSTAVAVDAKWKLVAENTANWARDQALTVATDMLTAHPNLKAIFANNDEEAYGALAAVKARNRQGQVIIIGYNGTCGAFQSLLKGDFQADGVLQDATYGQDFIDSAVTIGKGGTIEKRIAPVIYALSAEEAKAINDGSKPPPFPSLKTGLATAAAATGSC